MYVKAMIDEFVLPVVVAVVGGSQAKDVLRVVLMFHVFVSVCAYACVCVRHCSFVQIFWLGKPYGSLPRLKSCFTHFHNSTMKQCSCIGACTCNPVCVRLSWHYFVLPCRPYRYCYKGWFVGRVM
jgi:hypothetical protein